MSFGKMNVSIDIITTAPIKDADGFVSSSRTALSSSPPDGEELARSVAPPLPTRTASLGSRGDPLCGDIVLATVRAYREDKHGSERWANMAAFSTASAMFRFRRIPGITIDTTLYIMCDSERFRIVSVEDVRGRGMYIVVYVEKIEGSVR